ncbi:patatin-like phospholipase family protein [Rahnella aceris]|uniref:patatin-like phospholipase family protein n=1 Tax=Rahnella sp. (strain Y9602) TaxID=2703885 RepID=UPI003FD1A89A
MGRKKDISLALSGGGVRAMAFHAGVLKCMADENLLENIKNISTVSGGSLLIGLVFKINNYRWPSSKEYLDHVYPYLKHELCEKSLMKGFLFKFLNIFNLKYLLSRANVLSIAIKDKWDINVSMQRLPILPDWSINGTTAENGKRFRFNRDNIGDYETGYASAKDILLADAMSVSSAFPGLIGPFSLIAKNYRWFKREWGAPEENAEEVTLPTKEIRIYDGGVYDNLGLEPFFNQSKGESKENIDFIICSDAGAPLKFGFSYWKLNPWRLKRVMDIMSEQSRSLRVRTFVNYLKTKKNVGYYLNINHKENNAILNNGKKVGEYPTNIKKFSEDDFEAIANSGCQIMRKNLTMYPISR